MNIIMGVNAHLYTKGYVSKSLVTGKGLKLVSKGTGDGFINNCDEISITPIKLELTFKYITLRENYAIVNNEVRSSGKHIDINETKDLTQLDTFTPIFVVSEGISEEQLGTYKCLDLQLQ